MSDPTPERPAPALQEDLLRRIVEAGADAFYVVALDGRILDASQRACESLGYARDELLRLHLWDFAEGTSQETFAPYVHEIVSGGTVVVEGFHRRKDGTTFPVEVHAWATELEGSPVVLGLARERSAGPESQEVLRQRSRELEAVVRERAAQIRRSEERHRVLLEVNNAIISNLERQALFDAIAAALRQVVPFDRLGLALHVPERGVMKVHVLASLNPSRAFDVGAELSSRLARVLAERRPVRIPDLLRETRDDLEDRLVAEGIRSVMIVPLLTPRGAIGFLNLGSATPDRYSDEDAEFLADVAQQVAFAIENLLAYEQIAELKARVEQEKLYLQEEIKTEHNFEEIIGASRPIQKVMKAIEQVAPTEAAVLIRGETGSGKELVARAVHDLSARSERPLVKVNCAALPAGLIESELFGHERGAFTGALSRRTGRFELADGGTIFLDEIGDLPLELQGKLLRVLQEGDFERVGGTQTLRADVRVIAATNRDLDRAVREERFRPDLYYRLNVFPIDVPPLRERKDDIPLLVKYFVQKHGRRMGKVIESVPRKTMDQLVAYPWPGNVRELENVIERAVILSRGDRLELGEWPPPPGAGGEPQRVRTLEELERDHILEVLELTGWRVSGDRGAAEILGLKPTTLEARMKKLGIVRPR